MNTEAFEKWAKHEAMPETLKTYFLGGEGLPEDYDFEQDFKKFTDSRDQFYQQKHKAEIIQQYKDTEGKNQYIATVKPLQKAMISGFGLTEEQIKDKDIKGIIQAAIEKSEAEKKAAAEASGNSQSAELLEIKTKYAEVFKKANDLEDQLEAKLNTEREKYEANLRSYKIDNKLTSLLGSGQIDFDPLNAPFRKVVIENAFQRHGYKLDLVGDNEDLVIKSSDGSPAFTLDKTSTYEDVKSAIADIAKANNLIKRSNGGEGGGSVEGAGKVITDPALKRAAMLREKMGIK